MEDYASTCHPSNAMMHSEVSQIVGTMAHDEFFAACHDNPRSPCHCVVRLQSPCWNLHPIDGCRSNFWSNGWNIRQGSV